MTEVRIGVAQRPRPARERLEERLQLGKAAGLRIRHRGGQPGVDVHQNVTTARIVTGIETMRCSTGVGSDVCEYFTASSTPNGPDDTAPPTSAKYRRPLAWSLVE